MCDPDILFNFIKKMGSNRNFSLKDLTLKSVALVALTNLNNAFRQ